MDRSAIVRGATGALLVTALVVATSWSPIAAAGRQTPAVPPAASAAKAKELAAALQTKKLTSFAVRDVSVPGRYVALLHVPGVELLIVAATYERPTDIEYRLYQKDFMGAYSDLRSSALSKSRHFVADVFCDGLVAQPPKGQLSDTETVETTKHIFNGEFADPKKRTQPPKISFEDYAKQFTAADETYVKLLTVLLEELKKVG